MKISLHVLKYNVNIFAILTYKHFIDGNNIWMMKLNKEHDFSVGSLSISRIMKCIEVFLKSFYPFGFAVNYFKNMAIGSTSNLLNNFVSVFNVKIDVLRHFMN